MLASNLLSRLLRAWWRCLGIVSSHLETQSNGLTPISRYGDRILRKQESVVRHVLDDFYDGLVVGWKVKRYLFR